MVSSGLQKADNTRNKISNGNITITTKARLYILSLNPLLIARVTTSKHEKKKNKVYPNPKAPNTMQLIKGYVHITISTPKLFLKTTELRCKIDGIFTIEVNTNTNCRLRMGIHADHRKA